MYLWHKRAELHWVNAHEDALEAKAAGQLVIVRRPGRKRVELEVVCRSRSDSTLLLEQFGGHVEALSRNCIERFARGDSKPIKIGKRLIISNVGTPAVSARPRRRRHSTIIIPASLAFGTGDHATTAMCLRFLEQLTRRWTPGWTLADLGTGSGILTLAAKCFGAGHIVGIDNDPAAISVAKSNARSNQIRGADFQLGDVREWKSSRNIDVITANLYSDLLMEMLPKLRGSAWLILSGILRSQQYEFIRALRRNLFEILTIKNRGKWIAILARSGRFACTRQQAANFCGGHRPPLQ